MLPDFCVKELTKESIASANEANVEFTLLNAAVDAETDSISLSNASSNVSSYRNLRLAFAIKALF